ncbi:CarD family transcriptional regulator [Georgenia soli]|uniref:CarD family transcriptional regulator n=1 Tax=Georgenia soli TaxID=638953 RepID=A0A2A9EPZ2_9MICO|nr:CarD family transcriptional regulator [Georgenia soli]PFG40978.1 CarD family transcriptional regulator [Georgenia soli]
MQFSEGQIVVHPHHGPCTVAGVTNRTVRGVDTSYLDLAVHAKEMSICVPLHNVAEVGLRPVLDGVGLNELLDLLRAPTGEEEAGWSRRFKNNVEQLRTGDLLSTAKVVRDLTRRQADKGVSWGEKDLLRHARQPVVTELALALSLTEEEAGQALDEVILHGMVARLGTFAVAG